MRRATLLAVFALLVAAPAEAPARRAKAGLGEVIKASRLLYSQRIAEARVAVAERLSALEERT